MPRGIAQLLAADETIVLETRQHWFVLLHQAATRLLLLAVLGAGIWLVRDVSWFDGLVARWLGRAGWVAVTVVFVTVAWTVLGWLLERFYVTTSKVVYARGILHRDVTSTPLVKIDEMTLRQPLIGRLFGFGRLEVQNAGGGAEPLAGLEYLPDPARLYQLIAERSRSQRMIEGGAHRDADNDGLVDRGGPVG